jgi:hypothetical protein
VNDYHENCRLAQFLFYCTIFSFLFLLKFHHSNVLFQLKGRRGEQKEEDHDGVEMKKRKHLFLVCLLSCQLISVKNKKKHT